jgi:hypothetical protein
MTRSMRATSASVFLTLGVAAPGAAADQAPPSKVGIFVSDEAHLPERVVRHAQQEVTRIYRAVGVDIDWVDRAASTFRLTVVILPQEMAERMKRPPTAMGATPSDPSARGRLAYVFYDRVEGTARVSDMSIPCLLGHAMAHEIGHMLLPAGHSFFGLMRAQWGLGDLRLAQQGWLNFTPEQGEVIRARLPRL